MGAVLLSSVLVPGDPNGTIAEFLKNENQETAPIIRKFRSASALPFVCYLICKTARDYRRGCESDQTKIPRRLEEKLEAGCAVRMGCYAIEPEHAHAAPKYCPHGD